MNAHCWSHGPVLLSSREQKGRSASTQRGGYNAYEQTLLFLVEKSDCACIEAVIATDYLYLSGINFGLENRRR